MKTAETLGKEVDEKRKRKTQDQIEFDPNAGAFLLKPACKYLGNISPISLRRLVKRGLIKPNTALRHLIFARSELDRFLEADSANADRAA